MLEHYNVKATELKGTPKQIKWAEKIREELIEQVNDKSVPNLHHLFTAKTEKAIKFIDELKKIGHSGNDYFDNQIVINKIRQLIASEENAETFIKNQSLLSFLKTILK